MKEEEGTESFNPMLEPSRLDSQLNNKPHEGGISQEGMGSTTEEDDMKDRTAPRIITEERVSAGRTWFDADDEDGEWSRKKRWDDGEGRPDWKGEKNKQDYLKDLRTWASKLKLTQNQTREAERRFRQIDMSKSGTISSEATILAVITFVVNEDKRLIQQEDVFKNIRAGVDVSTNELRTARNQIRERKKKLSTLRREMEESDGEVTHERVLNMYEEAGFVPEEMGLYDSREESYK
jgi:Ca2+-binding EF-hand superfamily protein